MFSKKIKKAPEEKEAKIHDAAAQLDYPLLIEMIKQPSYVNQINNADAKGKTPIDLALDNEEMIINRFVNPRYQVNHQIETIKLLIMHGANLVHITDQQHLNILAKVLSGMQYTLSNYKSEQLEIAVKHKNIPLAKILIAVRAVSTNMSVIKAVLKPPYKLTQEQEKLWLSNCMDREARAALIYLLESGVKPDFDENYAVFTLEGPVVIEPMMELLFQYGGDPTANQEWVEDDHDRQEILNFYLKLQLKDNFLILQLLSSQLEEEEFKDTSIANSKSFKNLQEIFADVTFRNLFFAKIEDLQNEVVRKSSIYDQCTNSLDTGLPFLFKRKWKETLPSEILTEIEESILGIPKPTRNLLWRFYQIVVSRPEIAAALHFEVQKPVQKQPSSQKDKGLVELALSPFKC